jgi:hypothetical protein
MGKICYEKNGQQIPIPKDAFVAFVRLRTGARIGVVSITQDGKFKLNLREEYQFAWEDDSIDFYYTDNEGVVYNYSDAGIDLNTLYNHVGSGQSIVLTAK